MNTANDSENAVSMNGVFDVHMQYGRPNEGPNSTAFRIRNENVWNAYIENVRLNQMAW